MHAKMDKDTSFIIKVRLLYWYRADFANNDNHLLFSNHDNLSKLDLNGIQIHISIMTFF